MTKSISQRGILSGVGALLWFSAGFHLLASAAPAAEPLEFALFEEVSPVVYSANRIEEPLIEAPAAMTVITGEDLKNWGVVDLPDAFRFVPGMDVTAFSGREWGVTARGFNERLSRRMLVLVDGMSVYTPLFSGVSWQTLPLQIEDIEKIEISRGPNDTLYGFNAFNGVINITTKSPEKTHEVLAKYVYGSSSRHEFTGRSGLSQDLGGYGKLDMRLGYSADQSQGYGDNNGKEFEDARHVHAVNGRTRYTLSDATNLEYLFGIDYGPHSQGPVDRSVTFGDAFKRTYLFNAHQWRLNHEFSKNHKATLQFYRWSLKQDAKELSQGLADRDHKEIQYDAEFQDTLSQLEGRSTTVFGGNYRQNSVESLLVRHQFPPRRAQVTRDYLYSVFANEKFILLQNRPRLDRLTLAAGLRLEDSQFLSNPQWAPRVSLLYAPVHNHELRWTYARAYRLPSFLEEYFTSFTPADTGTTSQLLGNQGLRRERVDSYEVGYSGLFFKGRLSVDSDTYLADYGDLIHLVSVPDQAVATSSFNNGVDARSYGVENGVKYHLTPWFQGFANYTYGRILDNQNSPISRRFEDAIANHKASFGTLVNFKKGSMPKRPWLEGFSFNTNIAFTDGYTDYTEGGFSLESFHIKRNMRLDLRVAKSLWADRLEVAFVANNLVGSDHFEAQFVQVPRLFFLTVTFRGKPLEILNHSRQR